jgi:hypothetical protein
MQPMATEAATVQEEIPAAAVGEARSPEAPPAKANPGHFKPRDPRINRAGRPKGSKKAAADADPADLAPTTDRLRRLRVPRERLGLGWLSNLPDDAELVGACAEGGGLILMLRSNEFAKVAKGTRVPELPAADALRQGGGLARVTLPPDTEVVFCGACTSGHTLLVVRGPWLRKVAAGQPLPWLEAENGRWVVTA